MAIILLCVVFIRLLCFRAVKLHKANQGRAFYSISSSKSLWHQNDQLKIHKYPPVNFLFLVALVRELQDVRLYGGNYCKLKAFAKIFFLTELDNKTT